MITLLLLLLSCDRDKDEGASPDPTDSAAPEEEEIVCPDEPAPGPRLLRRLSHAEYAETLHDLLGYEVDAESLASDDVEGWFDNEASALDLSSLLAAQYQEHAEGAAEAADLDALLPCDPLEVGYAACATLFLEDFGLRAFRRPLSEADLARYLAFWEVAARDQGFEDGIRWSIAAMLQSPHFLYRMELGERQADDSFALTDWELATELSYLLIGSTPDAELLSLAEAGSLRDSGVLEAQALRLLADPRAEDRLATFYEGWLQLDRLATVSRDAETYPELTDALRTEMAGETRRLVVSLALDGGTLADLLLARHSYMTDDLAAYYGLSPGSGEADAEGFRAIELDGVQYGGLLTQGSVLTTHALPSTSSPIHRGMLIRERLLCQELPPPPSNLDTSPPAVDPTLSTRERYEQHASDPACSGCHSLIDPIGFGFESYDGVGRWRADDEGHAIDASGEIVGSLATNGSFEGPFALATLLATSTDVQTCYAEMSLTWAAGLYEDEATTCAAEALALASEPGEIPLLTPLLGVLDTPHFLRRLGEAGESDTPATGGRLPLDELPADTGTWGSAYEGDNATLTLTVTTDWGDGYCVTGAVENTSDTDVDWRVSSAPDGEIYTIWNAEVEDVDALWVFTGAEWNATLAPGESADFGFCATR